jgi:hypothetical protein
MSLVEDLQAEIGDHLRAVAVYHEADYEVVYERDDVATRPPAIDYIHQELIMEGMGTEHLEDVFDVGRLGCTMHSFEEAMCFHFVRGPLEGVFISVDPDALVHLETFVEICKSSRVEASL